MSHFHRCCLQVFAVGGTHQLSCDVTSFHRTSREFPPPTNARYTTVQQRAPML